MENSIEYLQCNFCNDKNNHCRRVVVWTWYDSARLKDDVGDIVLCNDCNWLLGDKIFRYLRVALLPANI